MIYIGRPARLIFLEGNGTMTTRGEHMPEDASKEELSAKEH
jgi:hypothetical protein